MRILLVGDSIDAGYGSSDGTGYRRALARGTPQHTYVGPFGSSPLFHAGAGGTKTPDWLPSGSLGKQLPGWIQKYKPDWVHIQLGTNDVIDHRLASDTAKNLSVIASAVSSLGPKVTIGTVPFFSEGKSPVAGSLGAQLNYVVKALNSLIESPLDTMGDYNRAIASFQTGTIAKDVDHPLTYDGTHPDDDGYAIIGNTMIRLFGGKVKDSSVSNATCDLPEGPLVWSTGPNYETFTFDTKGGDTGKPDTLLVLCKSESDAFQQNVVLPWQSSAKKYCDQYGVPLPWALGVINAESRGNPHAKASDGGVGLMQITASSLKAGHTDEELMDPDLNMSIGIKFLGQIIKQTGANLPKVLASYNYGTVSTENCRPNTTDPLWGLCNQQGHPSYITQVVMSSNSFIYKKMGNEGASNKGAIAIVALGTVAAAIIFRKKMI